MVSLRSLVSLKSLGCAAAVLALCATQAAALAPRDHAHAHHRHAHKAVAGTYVSLSPAPAAATAPQDTLQRTLDSNTRTAISIQESNHGDQHN